jgi:hypothetical protein
VINKKNKQNKKENQHTSTTIARSETGEMLAGGGSSVLFWPRLEHACARGSGAERFICCELSTSIGGCRSPLRNEKVHRTVTCVRNAVLPLVRYGPEEEAIRGTAVADSLRRRRRSHGSRGTACSHDGLRNIMPWVGGGYGLFRWVLPYPKRSLPDMEFFRPNANCGLNTEKFYSTSMLG